MKEISSFAEKFNQAYQKVATTAKYSMTTANEIGYGFDTKAVDMPEYMARKVEEFKGGCCFHHSWRLIYELELVGIRAYWAAVPEGEAEKCVVVYERGGARFVADIVEDVKNSLSPEDFIEYTCKWVNGDGKIIDNSEISLEKMAKINGYLHIYPKAQGTITFREFWQNCEYEEIIGC